MVQKNQTVFETARDIITMMKQLPPGERIIITVERHGGGTYYDWDTDRGTTCALSEAANELRAAYEKWFS